MQAMLHVQQLLCILCMIWVLLMQFEHHLQGWIQGDGARV